MRRVFAIGETVLDVIYKHGKLVNTIAGGSMLNSMISLGRIGMDAYLISEVGKDKEGERIISFLEKNGVDTSFIYRFEKGQTAIARAELNENNDASYTFTKDYPTERLVQKMPDLKADDIILFGSFFSVSPEVRQPLLSFLKKARAANCIIIYDPNIRNPHRKEVPGLMNYLIENMEFADIIRASSDDLKTIYNANDIDEALSVLKIENSQSFVYTSGGASVYFTANQIVFKEEVPDIQAISTIGAGDSFNAGLIYGLLINHINRDLLPKMDEFTWRSIIKGAINFASGVCQSTENYISVDFASQLEI